MDTCAGGPEGTVLYTGQVLTCLLYVYSIYTALCDDLLKQRLRQGSFFDMAHFTEAQENRIKSKNLSI